jgi:ferredoxin
VPEIAVDRDACMGSGTCVVLAPSTFAQDGDTKSVVVDARGDELGVVKEAVAACPMGALTLVSE